MKTTDVVEAQGSTYYLLALEKAEQHYAAETDWQRWTSILGILATVLAAASGVSAFSENGDLNQAGWLALSAAVASAINTFADPKSKATEHRSAAKRFESLCHRFAYWLDLQAPDTMQLKNLFEDYLKLNEDTPSIGYFARKRANFLIKKGIGEVNSSKYFNYSIKIDKSIDETETP